MQRETILETNFTNLKFLKRGKVRDLYEVDGYYLIVSTDRISAFDVVMKQGIPYKGIVLNMISNFWFDYTKNIIPNHIISTNVDEYPSVCKEYSKQLKDRSMLVKKTKVVPIECIIRGYITGSGWSDYKKTGEICGIKIKPGMLESEKFPEPLFTPSTKAEIGLHDENISIEKAKEIAGEEVINKMEKAAITLFNICSEYALTKGLIIADTKMEFGIDENNEILLIDELFTPDSSRFWPLEGYQAGKSQQSYDKQFVRDYLLSINFNKQPPPPDLPEEIIQKTSMKYIDALKRLTGKEIKD